MEPLARASLPCFSVKHLKVTFYAPLARSHYVKKQKVQRQSSRSIGSMHFLNMMLLEGENFEKNIL